MSCNSDKNGFTLVEVLVAMTLIATILSMVYGSYFATSRSARVCQARMAMCYQGRAVLDQMARQIRCAYIGPMVEDGDADVGKSGDLSRRAVQKDSISYFAGNPNALDGEILRFVTTSGFVEGQGSANGLLETAYRFDKRTGKLSLSQRRFIDTARRPEAEDWRPIAKDIERVELEFFDGRKWLRRWDFMHNKSLPHAVRIEIGCEAEDDQRYDYSTIAYISCRNNRAKTDTEV